MMIEVHGVNFVNKGDELMLYAVIQKFSDSFKDCDLAVGLRVGNFKQRARLGLRHKLWFDSKKVPYITFINGVINHLLPKKLCQMYDLVTELEIQAVLDASGFVYSDQWGPGRCEYMAKLSKRWKRQGKKIILLPKNYGPFENTRVKNAFLQIIDNVDLIFARDLLSYEYISIIDGHNSKVKIAPDYTILVRGRVPKYFNPALRQACIIPNYRMIDKTSEEISNRYISLLTMCIDYLIEKDIETFILIHDMHSDIEVSIQLKAQMDILGKSIRVIKEPDPIFIKGILGSCYITISSRFHGLVSSLSQGVPSLGTGWSHKYRMLFEGYGCPECLISPSDSQEEIISKLEIITEEKSRSVIIEKLKKTNLNHRKMVDKMWSDVFKVLHLN